MRQQQQQEESTPQATGFWKWPGWHRTVSTPVVTSETTATAESVAATQIAELEQAIQQRKRNRHRSHFVRITAFVVLAAMFPLVVFDRLFLNIGGMGSFASGLLALLNATISFSGLNLFFTFRGSRRLRQATEALTTTDELHAIGPLIEALQAEPSQYPCPAHDIAAVALARLLPRLNSHDTIQLNKEQRNCLLKELRTSANPRSAARYNPHFAVTLLHTLGKIQDNTALPLVTRLARSRGSKPAQESIRQAAQACLSVLSGHSVASDSLRPASSEVQAESAAATETGPSRIPTEAVETLMTQLHQDARTYRRRLLFSVAGIVFGGIGVFAMGSLGIMLREKVSLGWTMFLYAILAAGFFGIHYNASRTRSAVNALAGTDDLRVIGPLIEALAIPDGWMLRMAMDTLTRLLPRLQASDTSLLNDAQRTTLCRWLDRWAMDKRMRKSEFTVAILRALAQVGDEQAVPSVQRLANFAARTPAQVLVRDEATACLPFLEVRADQQHARQTLLRAATASAEPSEVLLRPATGAITADPQTLLRPSHSLDAVEVRTNGESKGTP